MNTQLPMKVKCIDHCAIVRVNVPRKERTPLYELPNIIPGKDYEVIETIRNNGKEFYRLLGFPFNHVFQKEAFIINS